MKPQVVSWPDSSGKIQTRICSDKRALKKAKQEAEKQGAHYKVKPQKNNNQSRQRGQRFCRQPATHLRR